MVDPIINRIIFLNATCVLSRLPVAHANEIIITKNQPWLKVGPNNEDVKGSLDRNVFL